MKNLIWMVLCLAPNQNEQTKTGSELCALTEAFMSIVDVDDFRALSVKVSLMESAAIKTGSQDLDDIRIVKSGIEQILNLPQKDRIKIIDLIYKFGTLYSIGKDKKSYVNSLYEALSILEKKISEICGEKNIISWIFRAKSLAAESNLQKSQVDSASLVKLIDSCKKNFGEKSLFISDLYLLLIIKLIKDQKNQEALNECLRAEHLLAMYAGKQGALFYVLQIYTAKCLFELGRHEEAQAKVAILNKDKLHSICSAFPFEFYMYNSLLSDWCLIKNKLNSSILYKEASISYLESSLNSADNEVAIEAEKLRNLFIKNHDWPSARKVESKYRLKPAPKQLSEK